MQGFTLDLRVQTKQTGTDEDKINLAQILTDWKHKMQKTKRWKDRARMSNGGGHERQTDWLIDWWRTETIGRSPLSSVIFCDLEPIPIYRKKKKRSQSEKQAAVRRWKRWRRGQADRSVADSDDDHLSSAPHTPRWPADRHADDCTHRPCSWRDELKNLYFSSFP